jgi:hypothetical protein
MYSHSTFRLPWQEPEGPPLLHEHDARLSTTTLGLGSVITQFEVPGETHSLALQPTLVAVISSAGSIRFFNRLIVIEDNPLCFTNS